MLEPEDKFDYFCTRMNQANIYKIFISLTAVLLFSLACNTEPDFVLKKELELIDSLEMRSAVIQQKLDIDLREIDERVEEMRIDIGGMRLTDKAFPPGMGKMMDRYTAIQKAYTNFYTPYKQARVEADEIKVQLITLREGALKKEFSKQKFKEYYAEESMSLEKLEGYVEKHIQPVLDMERDYKRIQSAIDRHLYSDELKKENSKK